MAESHREEIAKLEALYASNPGGRVFVHLAEAYRKAGEHDRARRILTEGLERHPDSASAYVVLGRVLVDAEEDTEAEAAFARVLELDGGNLVALRWLGDLARKHGRAEDARGHYRDLLARNPNNQEVQELLASVDAMAAASAPAAEEVPAASVAPGRVDTPAPAEPEFGIVQLDDLPGDLGAFAGLAGARAGTPPSEPVSIEEELGLIGAFEGEAEATPFEWGPDAEVAAEPVDAHLLDASLGVETFESALAEEESAEAEVPFDFGTLGAVEEPVEEYTEGSLDLSGFDETAAEVEAPVWEPEEAEAEVEAPVWEPAETAAEVEPPVWEPAETAAEVEAPVWEPEEAEAEVEAPAWEPAETAAEVEAPVWEPGEPVAEAEAPIWQPEEIAAEEARVWEPAETAAEAEEPVWQPAETTPEAEETQWESIEPDVAVEPDFARMGAGPATFEPTDVTVDASAAEPTAEELGVSFPGEGTEDAPAEMLLDELEAPPDYDAGYVGDEAAEFPEPARATEPWEEASASEAAVTEAAELPAAVSATAVDQPFLATDPLQAATEALETAPLTEEQAAEVAARDVAPLPGVEGAYGDAVGGVPTEEDDGLVTETMAELYRTQGFGERAADVYRTLLRRRPDDARLAARLQELESSLAKPQVEGLFEEDESGEVWLRGVGTAWTGTPAAEPAATPYAWTDAPEETPAGEPVGNFLRSLTQWRRAQPAGAP